jgi:hypothetical protein
MTGKTKTSVAIYLFGALAFTGCGESPTRPMSQPAQRSVQNRVQPNAEDAQLRAAIGDSIKELREYSDAHPIPGMTREQTFQYHARQTGLDTLINAPQAATAGSPGKNTGFVERSPEDEAKDYEAHKNAF